jgi:hypothetical protein
MQLRSGGTRPKFSGAGNSCPVFQLIACNSVSDVVGGECEAVDFYQQRLVGQRRRVGQLRFDDLALLQIVASDDEVGGLHWLDPCRKAAV